MPHVSALHHVTLSVSDLARSRAWYERALLLAHVADRSGNGWTRVLLRSGDGPMIGLTQHTVTPESQRFDATRIGLDHLSIRCAGLPDLREWREHLDGLDIAHDGVVETPGAYLLVTRDPDGIPIEFFAPR